MTKNLLFDLGGVIMEIDRNRAVKAFSELGMADADAFFDPYLQRGHFLQLEQGAVSPEQFRAAVRPLFASPVSDDVMDHALEKFLIGIPVERLERLKELRRAGHNVYMLSNTNMIMWNGFIAAEFRKLGGDVNDYFDGIVTSFEAKVCKPERRIFEYTVEKLGIEPAETTFFDDGEANVEAARRFGMKAELVTPANDFMTLTRL